MNIYIASSWRNQHAVEMLTHLLRKRGHTVWSFVEKNADEQNVSAQIGFEAWVVTESAKRCFDYDVKSAKDCDLCIYIGPAGKDAAAELGIAYANNKPIIGLYAKGEDFGLMRKIVTQWVDDFKLLLSIIDTIVKTEMPIRQVLEAIPS